MITGELSLLIDAAILPENAVPEYRNYIGASSIGNPCERSVWYRYKNTEGEPISPKIQRTFAIGKRLEGLILDCLEQAGTRLNRTWEALSDTEVPIFQGHIDAMLMDVDNKPVAIIEVKTARDSSFKIFVKNGLLQWSPSYYSQVQAYMGMSGVHQAYVIVLNKDTSEIHDQQVKFEPIHYKILKDRARSISESQVAPRKINHSPMYFACRMCVYKGICHTQ